jgi:tetratricopeptide (TPR) repeat protein
VLVTGHVWCRVIARDGNFDVETTSRGWRLSESNFSASPATSSTPRELDDAGLVALIHYNRSVVELHAGHYAEAATAARAALELDPAARLARDNLAATYNNWAVARAEAQDHEGALKLLATAREIAPHDERLIANARRLYARSYEAQVSAGDLVNAAEIVSVAANEFPDDDYFFSRVILALRCGIRC